MEYMESKMQEQLESSMASEGEQNPSAVDQIRNQLWRGDCLELMRNIPDASIDFICCDLPYGTTACRWDSVIPFDALWKEYRRIIKPRRAIALFGSEPFSSAMRMSNMNSFKYDWIWDKVVPSGMQIAKFVPMKQHEIISIFCESSPRWFPQVVEMMNPTSSTAYGSDSSPLASQDFKPRVHTHRNPKTILTFPKPFPKNYLHPTQKPAELLEYLIKTYTERGELVLDNCAGSGTTGAACQRTGRDYLLIEREESYCQIIEARLAGKLSQSDGGSIEAPMLF